MSRQLPTVGHRPARTGPPGPPKPPATAGTTAALEPTAPSELSTTRIPVAVVGDRRHAPLPGCLATGSVPMADADRSAPRPAADAASRVRHPQPPSGCRLWTTGRHGQRLGTHNGSVRTTAWPGAGWFRARSRRSTRHATTSGSRPMELPPDPAGPRNGAGIGHDHEPRPLRGAAASSAALCPQPPPGWWLWTRVSPNSSPPIGRQQVGVANAPEMPSAVDRWLDPCDGAHEADARAHGPRPTGTPTSSGRVANRLRQAAPPGPAGRWRSADHRES